jgi:hypothetical protein
MAKLVHDNVLDAALNLIKTTANLMVVCSTQPTTRAEAVTTYALADVAMTSTDYTVSNGDTNGRKVRVAAKSAVPVDVTGSAQHIALVDATNLLYVTTCTTQTITSGNTVDIPVWDIEIADPA